MPEKLSTARSLAPLFGVKPTTIYKWRRRGLLTGYATEGTRLIRFKESDIRKLFEKREVAK